MKPSLQTFLLSLLFLLIVQISFAQNKPKEWKLVCTANLTNKIEEKDCLEKMHNKIYNTDFFSSLDDGYVEIKNHNTQYAKVWLNIGVIGGFSSLYTSYTNSFIKEINKKTNGSGTYNFLYKAYVELAPDAKGQKKAQLLLFFSPYNAGFNGKKTPSFAKEVLADMDKKPILLAELYPDKYVDVYKYTNSESGGLQKAYATTTFIYDAKSLYPEKEPILTAKKYDFKLHLTDKDCYEKSTQINLNANGKATELVEYFPKEGGYTLNLKRGERLDENGKVKEVHFNDVFGMDLSNGQVFFNTRFHLPKGVKDKWKLKDFNSTPDLLEDLTQILGRKPIEDKEQLREFLTNFQTLNEYIILDETDKVGGPYNPKPKKYIYKGTYNKEGNPHGWGLMYVLNEYDQYYVGQFKNGKPDGFGIRHDFNLDKPEKRYRSYGIHVGNQLIFGAKYYNSPNGNGHYAVYGDFREGELNGKGSLIWSQGDNGIGDVYWGYFQNGKLHGEGHYYTNNKKEIGVFAEGSFISGDKVTDKMYDNNFYPGAVVLYNGKKYVIMKKEKGRIYLDGIDVASTANLILTGERSVQRQVCNVCNGTGYLNPTTNTVFSGVTQKQKSYHTGPTGYILWEKTTTTTTAPVTTYRTNRCTACTGGLSGNKPVPLNR